MSRISGFIILLLLFRVSNIFPESKNTSTASHDKQSGQSLHYNADPELIADGPFAFPVACIKRGVKGTLTVAVDIDNKGFVENCHLKQGLNPLLDSAIVKSLKQSRYKPAVESGKEVSSSVILELFFDYEQIVRNSRFDPVFDGYITDKESGLPLQNALVNIAPSDTINDTTILGGLDNYLALIGTVPGQKCVRGIISTSTDSTGYFSFKLLPSADYKVSVLMPGFEIAQHEELINGAGLSVRYAVNPFREIIDSSYSITVYGMQDKHREVIRLENEQLRTGLTHYASKVLLSKAIVRSVPESPSQMLVRLGSPFDNRYNVGGVMMLAPFHFGGHPYADIDGLMLSSLEDINIVVNGIAGTAPDVSGIVVHAKPGVYRPADKRLKPRPEFSLDFSTTCQDFLMSVANKRGDYLQLGYTRAEDYTLKIMSFQGGFENDSTFGLGLPVSFGNVTSNACITIGDIISKTFVWFAYDSYSRNFNNVFVPWGMGNIEFTPRYNNNLKVTCGGSHQYFTDGIQAISGECIKKVELSSADMSIGVDSIHSGNVTGALLAGMHYVQWYGKSQLRGNDIDTVIRNNLEEMSLNLNGELVYTKERLTFKSNGLVNVVSYNLSEAEYSVDGGAGISFNEQNYQISLDAGVVHSRPDIRGIPVEQYRKRISQSLLISCQGKYFRNDKIIITMNPYLRYQLNVPKLNPEVLVWDALRESDVFGGGIDVDMFVALFDKLELSGALNISDGKRIGEETGSYEWNVPFTIRGKIHTKFYHDLLHLYISLTKSSGLPYYDFAGKQYRNLPDYNSVDLSVQYRSKSLERRFLSRYDAYFNVHNVFGMDNIRGYQWSSSGSKIPVYLSGNDYIECGVKFALRF